MPIRIRRYTAADLPRVLQLHFIGLEQFRANAPRGNWDADMNDIEGAYLNNEGEFLVGEVGGVVVAMGALRKKSSVIAEVKRIRVHPDHQRRGYGQAVLSELENRARSLGYSTLRLDTTVSMVPAQKLYEKNGFVEVDRKKLGGFEMILYQKTLR